MEPSRVLTVEEIDEGLVAAVGWRRFWTWHGLRLAALMGGGGLLLLAVGYFVQGRMSLWGFLIPAGLVAAVLPSSVSETRHFTRMLREFQAAKERALAGGVVRAADIPSLSRRPAA
jgi:hypothetical protein